MLVLASLTTSGLLTTPRAGLVTMGTGKVDPKAPNAKAAARLARGEALAGQGGFNVAKRAPKRSERKAARSGKGFGGGGTGLNYDRVAVAEKECVCGSGETYGVCCGPEHAAGGGNDVERVMRARYAAFAQRQPDFLMRTTHPEGEEWNSDTAAWKKELLGFTDSFFFAGLKVGEVKTLGDDKASVKFTANLVRKEGVIPFDLEETSEFVRGADGNWLYTHGDVEMTQSTLEGNKEVEDGLKSHEELNAAEE